jgi:hypothetical protein
MFMSVARNVRQLSSIGMSCSPSWNESSFTTQGARLIHSITWNLYTISTENHNSMDSMHMDHEGKTNSPDKIFGPR